MAKEQTHLLIGIDPGYSGAVSFIKYTPKTKRIVDVEVIPMPRTPSELHALLSSRGWPKHVVLEQAHCRPRDAKRSIWAFSGQYHTILCVLELLQLKTTIVSPMKWMNKLQCRTGGDKNITYAYAQKKFRSKAFPRLKFNQKTAESLLIGYYGVIEHG